MIEERKVCGRLVASRNMSEEKQIYICAGFHEMHSNEPYKGSGFWNGEVTYWSASCSCCSWDRQMTYLEAIAEIEKEIARLEEFKEKLRRRESAKQMST
jgi:hypothetical protein